MGKKLNFAGLNISDNSTFASLAFFATPNKELENAFASLVITSRVGSKLLFAFIKSETSLFNLTALSLDSLMASDCSSNFLFTESKSALNLFVINSLNIALSRPRPFKNNSTCAFNFTKIFSSPVLIVTSKSLATFLISLKRVANKTIPATTNPIGEAIAAITVAKDPNTINKGGKAAPRLAMPKINL